MPSLTKVFPSPNVFEAALETVQVATGRPLEARHVLVATELEDIVVQVLMILPKYPEKVRRKSRCVGPLGFAEASLQSDLPIVVNRTFIDVKWKNSLRPEEHSGAVTASTTDAHARGGQSPRAV